MGRSTWAKLQKAKETGALPDRHTSSQMIEEEDEVRGSNEKMLKPVEDQEEDAPNQYIDEMGDNIRKKILFRMNVDASADFVKKPAVVPRSDNFITEDLYDPNDLFSEF